eukprot:277715-Prorocentrum_minimum.AAC.1
MSVSSPTSKYSSIEIADAVIARPRLEDPRFECQDSQGGIPVEMPPEVCSSAQHSTVQYIVSTEETP